MSKALVFAYAAVSYAAFSLTYLYAVGSVGQRVAPTPLDSDPAASFGGALLVNLGLLGLFAVQHRAMARRAPATLGTVSTIGALILICALPLQAQDHSHAPSSDRWSSANPLVQVVRESTERFKDVSVAEYEDYHLLFGCVSGEDNGAMGLHYVNLGLVFDGGELDPAHPEIVLYEPSPTGRLRITGADFLVIAKDWDDKHPGNPPQLMGQLFHRFESPNRFGLPDFYTLHVWAWKDNPTGTFVNWHANVSCDGFKGQ